MLYALRTAIAEFSFRFAQFPNSHYMDAINEYILKHFGAPIPLKI